MPKKNDSPMPNLVFGKKEKLVRRQPSMWDSLKEQIKEPGDFVTGFADGAQAAQAATRLRKVWGIKAVSWVDPIDGPTVGILTTEEEGE